MNVDDLIKMTEEEIGGYFLRQKAEIYSHAQTDQELARLRGVQWKCDMIKEKYKDDDKECINALQGMMWQSFLKLNDHLND